MDAGRHGHVPPSFRDTHDAALWPAQPVQLARGRQPRDALAKTIPYTVSSVQEFETSLRGYLNHPPEQPEHTEAQLSFFIGTIFDVSDTTFTSTSTCTSTSQSRPAQGPAPQPSPQRQPQQPTPNGPPLPYGRPSHAYQSVPDPADATSNDEPRVNLSIPDALAPTQDPKDKMRKQRAIAKCCVDAIQRVDGYRYSFHNCWNSREDDSFRFSYYCNDSLLNKDRAANGKGAKFGKRATKPVFDCKGVLSIKFSATKKSLDVFYKHVPIHGTYEERAPPPRKDSKRRKFLEVHDPEALERIASRPNRLKPDFEDPSAAFNFKKKRLSKSEAQSLSNTSIESDLRTQSLHSLLELICVDPVTQEPSISKPPPPPPLPPPPPPDYAIVPEPPMLQIPMRNQLIQQRKRPRNSCDVCKAKKTKCDGTRPVCSTCLEKKRQCLYSEPINGNDPSHSNEPSETAQQAQATRHEVSELEKMRRELEDAKARIQELESEKRATPAPVNAPHVSLPPSQLQPQPHQRSQTSHSQTQPHISQQRQQPPSNHRQQLQQMNQNSQRALGSPQQIGYKQQHIQAAAQNYFNTHPSQLPYSTMNRPMAPNSLSTPNTHLPQPNQSQTQPQSQASHQIHANDTGLTPTPTSVDANHPYGRGDYSWPPPTAYYSYPNASQQQQQQPPGQQQQHQPPPPPPPPPPTQQQQEQWAAARSSGVFR